MDAHELIQSFAEFAKQKNIDRPTMIRILEDVFRNMIRKRYESDENFDIIINADKGDLEIYRFREIVDDDSEDIWDFDKIGLTEAQKIEPDFEVGPGPAFHVYLVPKANIRTEADMTTVWEYGASTTDHNVDKPSK